MRVCIHTHTHAYIQVGEVLQEGWCAKKESLWQDALRRCSLYLLYWYQKYKYRRYAPARRAPTPSVYLLYWYNSTNTDATHFRVAPPTPHQLMSFFFGKAPTHPARPFPPKQLFFLLTPALATPAQQLISFSPQFGPIFIFQSPHASGSSYSARAHVF